MSSWEWGSNKVSEEWLQNTCGSSEGYGVLEPAYSDTICGIEDWGEGPDSRSWIPVSMASKLPSHCCMLCSLLSTTPEKKSKEISFSCRCTSTLTPYNDAGTSTSGADSLWAISCDFAPWPLGTCFWASGYPLFSGTSLHLLLQWGPCW